MERFGLWRNIGKVKATIQLLMIEAVNLALQPDPNSIGELMLKRGDEYETVKRAVNKMYQDQAFAKMGGKAG